MKIAKRLILAGVIFAASIMGLAFARSANEKQDTPATQAVAGEERVEGSWYITVNVTEP